MNIKKLGIEIIGWVLMLGGVALAIYLMLYIMIYGGFWQLIDNWGDNRSLAMVGLVRILFFPLGVIPSYGMWKFALRILAC